MNVDFVCRYETGEATEEEIITEFQKMIDDGSVWKLQGFYGREAKRLIDEDLCHWPDKPTSDYYGNSLPVRSVR